MLGRIGIDGSITVHTPLLDIPRGSGLHMARHVVLAARPTTSRHCAAQCRWVEKPGVPEE